jgi:hypothetical protein
MSETVLMRFSHRLPTPDDGQSPSMRRPVIVKAFFHFFFLLLYGRQFDQRSALPVSELTGFVANKR